MQVDRWRAQESRQGVTAEVSSACKRNVMSWTRANSSSSRSTLVPVRGLAGERTSSWYIIDQRLICQGFENLLRSDYGTTSVNFEWVGTRQRE